MPKSPTYSKHSARNSKSKGPQRPNDVEYANLSDELKSDDGLCVDQEAESNAELIKAARHSLVIVQKSKKSNATNVAIFQARKKALYLDARKSAKELVKSSVTLVEDVQAKLAELRIQQNTFGKYYGDYHSPRTSLQETFAGLVALYPPMLNDLGIQRSEILEGASTMLKDNAPRRQDVLKEFSKSARQQLEQVKQLEKDAQDAAELIKHVKNLLRG